jgi:hypothetical protein
MEVDLQSLFGLHVMHVMCPAVLIGNPHPPPPQLGLYEGAIGQQR